MNETSKSYYPKLSRYETRKSRKAKKQAKYKKLCQEAFSEQSK